MIFSLYRILANPDSSELRNGPGGKIGAIFTLLMFFVASFSSWATYEQLAVGLTYVTLLVLISLLLGLLYFLSQGRLPRLLFGDYCVGIIYIISLASNIWSVKAIGWPLQIFWYSICFITYFTVRLFITTPARIRLVGFGVIVGVFLGGFLMSTHLDQWGNIVQRQSIGNLNQNFTAYIFAGSLYIYLIINKYGLFPRLISMIAIPLLGFIFFNVLLLDSRGALISCIAICFWFLIHKLLSRRIVIIVVAMSLFFVLMSAFGFFDPLLRFIDSFFSRNTGDLAGRLPVWELARSYIANNFFLGIGVGSFGLLNPSGTGAHNVFLTLLLDTGFFGFIFFFLFLVSIFYPVFRKSVSSDIKFIFGAFFSFWLPIAASGHWELAPFSWLLLGLTFNLLRLSRVNFA